MVGATTPGAKADVKVLRDGKEKSFTCTLKEMPEKLDEPGPAGAEPAPAEALRGITLADIDDDARPPPPPPPVGITPAPSSRKPPPPASTPAPSMATPFPTR